MDINVINSIKKHKQKKPISNKEETSSILENEAVTKVSNIDINGTVKQLKDTLYNQLNLSSQISRNRLGIMISRKVEQKEVKMFLSDDNQTLLFYDGISEPSTLFYLKDIGPQINYRLVYVIEYLGPLIFTIFFFIRYVIIRLKMHPDESLQTHIIFYFFMSFFHYAKRILESIYVHIFSRTTMPLMNLFKNCAYYWGIFGILCGYTLFNPYSEDIKFLVYPRYFFILFFFSAELKNLKTHMILRDIKIKGKGKKYIPPKIEGFELVTCANYLWEFFAWFSFSVFSLNIFVIIFTICGFLQMKQWALKKHNDMKKNYGAKYSKEIFAFIPYFI